MHYIRKQPVSVKRKIKDIKPQGKFWTGMKYPAASYGVSTVIPAPNQVRDKLQPESRNMLDWIPDQVRDDKTKQASGILVRRIYGGLVCLWQI